MNIRHGIKIGQAGQQGLTLIEIMVAMLVGAFLMAGVLQVFIVNKQTYRVQENLSRLQENGRFAMDYLNRYIRMAGTRSDNILSGDQSSEVSENFTGSNRAVGGTYQTDLNQSDTLTVRFYADSYAQMTDCLGNQTNLNLEKVMVVNQFSIKSDPNNKNQPTLYCDPEHRNAGANNLPIINNPLSQPILEGVENMRVYYCGDRGAGIGCVLANQVQSSDWNRVKSIRISLLMRSSENNLVQEPQPYQFDANGDGVEETVTPNDRFLRRVFTTTIALRNMG